MVSYPPRHSGLKRRRVGISAQDALVFAVIALVAVALIEALILANTTPVLGQGSGSGPTATTTITRTTPSLTTTTLTTTSTVTSVSHSTDTLISIGNPSTSTSTSTSYVTNTSISTYTDTVTSTTTSTDSPNGPFVAILPGDGSASPGYSPDFIIVVIGINNTVTWVNYDSIPHSATSTSGPESFNSGSLQPGQSFTFTFDKSGTYTYSSTGSVPMGGTVVVKV